MIDVIFSVGTYEIRDSGKLISYASNIYDALNIASESSNGEPFTISCHVPKNDDVIKAYYICPACGSTAKFNSSLNTCDFEPHTKDDYVYCSFCDMNYIVSWLPNPSR